MRKILFLLLSVVALSSCCNIRENGNKKEILYSLNYYTERAGEVLERMSESKSCIGIIIDNKTLSNYTDSIHKYKSLLNDLNDTNK